METIGQNCMVVCTTKSRYKITLQHWTITKRNNSTQENNINMCQKTVKQDMTIYKAMLHKCARKVYCSEASVLCMRHKQNKHPMYSLRGAYGTLVMLSHPKNNSAERYSAW